MLFAGFAVADRASSHAHHHLTLPGSCSRACWARSRAHGSHTRSGAAGRLELFERHGAKVHMGPAQIGRADRWFQRYGEPVVLFGRMIPLVRAFVSLPAGVARMPVVRFTLLTLIGSLPWVLVLAIAGKAAGSDWKSIRKGFEYADYAIVVLVVLAVVALVVRRRQGRVKPAVGPTE